MEEEDLYIQHLIEAGAIEIVALNDDGEYRFSITERCAEIAPELYHSYIEDISMMMFELWTKDMVDVSMSDTAEWIFRLTDKGLNMDLYDLDPFERELLQNMRSALG